MAEAERPVAEMRFEEALAELEAIVDKLEKGQVPLEESIRIYERGAALKDHCEALLKQAEAKIEKIALGKDGEVKGAGPLDVE